MNNIIAKNQLKHFYREFFLPWNGLLYLRLSSKLSKVDLVVQRYNLKGGQIRLPQFYGHNIESEVLAHHPEKSPLEI